MRYTSRYEICNSKFLYFFRNLPNYCLKYFKHFLVYIASPLYLCTWKLFHKARTSDFWHLPAKCNPPFWMSLLLLLSSLLLLLSFRIFDDLGLSSSALLPFPFSFVDEDLSTTSWSALQNSSSSFRANSSPGISCLLHATQRKQSIWYTFSRARITKSLLPKDILHFEHFAPKFLKRNKKNSREYI